MANSISRILIETIVRKALRDLREYPERNMRNLVDMALNFSKGRFQTKFFKCVQRMLRNEQSAYYRLAHHVAENVDHERLISFGMNIGYNSCTIGAKKIRDIEAVEHFNIPWALFLEIDKDTISQQISCYDSLIRQGTELGIFTWFVYANGIDDTLFDLMAAHTDCAFILICDPNDITEAVIDRMIHLNHLMVCVRACDSTEKICQRLRENKMLYSVYIEYSDDNMSDILDDTMLYDIQSLNALFAVFIPKQECENTKKQIIYDYICQTREKQEFPILVWEMFQDVLWIDTIISEAGCSGGLFADGTFFTLAEQKQNSAWNMHDAELKDILTTCLKK